MHAVGSLVKDDTVRTVEHFVGNFFAAMRRQAMHNPHVVRRMFQQFRIHPESCEGLPALRLFAFLPHACPDIGVNHVGLTHRFRRFVEILQHRLGKTLLQTGVKAWLKAKCPWASVMPAHTQHGTTNGQRPSNVVAIPDKGQCAAGKITKQLGHGHEIGQSLAGMLAVTQTVDDRDGGIAGKFLHRLVPEHTQHDGLYILAERTSTVRETLADAQTHLLTAKKNATAAESRHSRLEADTRSQGRFLKNQSQDATSQRRFLSFSFFSLHRGRD